MDDTPQIGFDLGPPVFFGGLFNRCHIGVAGIIDHDIKSPEDLYGGGNDGTSLFRIGHIERYGANMVSILRDKITELLRVAGCGDQEVTMSEDSFGETSPKSA